MSRRTLTLLLASALALVLTAGAAVARVPYVALGPGPTYNTLGEFDGRPVIEIDGRETFPTDGNLDLTTVGVQPRLTLATALRGWFARDLAVVPREVVFPPGRTDQQVDEENAASMRASQDDAVLAALRQLGVPSTVEVSVVEVGDDTPAEGRLQVDDVVTAVDGQPVRSAEELRTLVSGRRPGDPVLISYVRQGRTAEVQLTTAAREVEGEMRAVIGVVTAERADFPFEVRINLRDVGGPSAGLMFALGIIDKLGPESLTGGQYIAGTGEISADGQVGPIGGIPQKLIAAREKGADAFLVPAGNCDEALRGAPEGLDLVRVGTLEEALSGLAALRAGQRPPLCAA